MSNVVRLNQDALNHLLHSPNGPVAQDLQRRAQNVVNTAVRLSGEKGSGVTYQRGGITHQASAPGQPFASDTGQLRASMHYAMGADVQGLYARIGSNLEYAAAVELGTRNMAARPTLRRALRAAGDGSPGGPGGGGRKRDSHGRFVSSAHQRDSHGRFVKS